MRWATVLLGVCVLTGSAAAQRDAARGRRVIDQAIQALGGQAYLSVRDSHSEGRGFSFSHFEEISGMSPIWNFERYPNQFRQEQGKHHEAVYVINGNIAWDANYHGVAPVPEADLQRQLLSRALSVDTILRFRLQEKGIEVTFTGTDFVDGHPCDMVEVVDADGRLVNIAFDRESHLPMRRDWERPLPNHEREQNVETLGKYTPAKNSVVLFPHYIRRERQGRKVFEAFLTGVEVNKNLPDSLFDRPRGPDRPIPGKDGKGK